MLPSIKKEPPSPTRKNVTSSAFLKTLSTQERSKVNVLKDTDQHENAVQKARREEREKKELKYRLLDAQKRFEIRRNQAIRFKELRQKRRKLVYNIELRPQDKKSTLALIDIAYELEDYFQVCTVIKRSLEKFDDLRTHDVYLKLGRCFLRRWKKDGRKEDICEAFEAYKNALNNPETLIRPLACPIPYLEFVGVCTRLDHTQMALDTLGAMMARWKDDYDLLVLCQYIVAQISLASGRIKDASNLYQQLMLCPNVVEPLSRYTTELKTSMRMVSSSVVSTLCQVELACLQHRLGHDKLSVRMFAEAFARQNKQGPTVLQDGHVIDIRNGETNFNAWATSSKTYKYLGDLLAKTHMNLAMAAEMYGLASEVYSRSTGDISKLSKLEKAYLCGLVLDRGECLVELCVYESAEHCGRYAYSVLPLDSVVTGRAARCCHQKTEQNAAIHSQAAGVYRAVELMSRILSKKVAARRKEARLALNNYATTINSGIRMALVRNRLAGDFLELTTAGNIASRIFKFRGLWKSGKKELQQWVELWNVSCNIIQRGMWRWFIRRKNTKVIRGINGCKRIWRGQRVRSGIRDKISAIQDKLDANGFCEHGEEGLYFDSLSVKRLTCGMTALTHAQNEPSVSLPRISSSAKLSPDKSLSRAQSERKANEFPLQLKSRNARKHPVGAVDAGNSWFAPSNSTTSYSSPQRAELKSNSAPASVNIYSPTSSSNKSPDCQQSSAVVSIEELDMLVQMSAQTGEDVITLISKKSMLNDMAYKWIPFAILPEEGVVRLLTCTALVVTSPSFGLQDSMRIVYYCRRYKHLWSNIKALHVYGTRLAHGPGLRNLLNLGLHDMHTLTIAHTGLPPSFGSYLGEILSDLGLDMKSKSSPLPLTKLYIENEPRFGINGTLDLAKRLQFNSSLRILSLRRCGLNYKVVRSLSVLVSLSKYLEILNVNDNNFSYADCRQLLHAVANKGVKGNFRGLYCIGNYPKLKHSDLESLFSEGLRLNVNVVTGEIDTGGIGFRKELSKEKDLLQKGIDIEQSKLETLETYIHEIKRLGKLEDWERVSMVGTKSYKAIYL